MRCGGWVACLVLAMGCGAGDDAPAGYWGTLAAVDGTAYFGTFGQTDREHAIWSRGTDGVDHRIWQGSPGGDLGHGLDVNTRDVFWNGADADGPEQVFRAPRDGGDRTTIATFSSNQVTQSVVATEDAVFASNEASLLRVDLATGVVDAIDGGGGWLARRGDTVFVLGPTPGAPGSSTLSKIEPGSARVAIAVAPVESSPFTVGTDAAYVQGMRVPFDGTPATTLIANAELGAVAVDTLYTTVKTNPTLADGVESLWAVPLDGSPPTMLRDDLHFVFGLALDGPRLWVAQCDCSTAGFVEAIDVSR